MDLQPTLEGELVVLRPIRADDWEEMYAAGSDPLIWELHPARNRWKEHHFRRYFEEAIASGGAFAILDKARGQIIGSSRYTEYDAARDEIEIGWTFLTRAYWGGAYNGEVKRLMLDHIHTHVATVYFMIGEHNLRSRRAIEKIGGQLRPDPVDKVFGDVTLRHVVYEIKRPRDR